MNSFDARTCKQCAAAAPSRVKPSSSALYTPCNRPAKKYIPTSKSYLPSCTVNLTHSPGSKQHTNAATNSQLSLAVEDTHIAAEILLRLLQAAARSCQLPLPQPEESFAKLHPAESHAGNLPRALRPASCLSKAMLMQLPAAGRVAAAASTASSYDTSSHYITPV